MASLESLIEGFGDQARTRIVAQVPYRDKTYPLYCLVLGSQDPAAPSVGYFAGVHGLEKIGSEVVLAYMQTLLELVRWDQNFRARLKDTRVVFMPIINPVGIVYRTRSNGSGVDIMRNSPLEAEQPGGGIYRGHRLTPKLPWYRGVAGAEMEIETRALIEVVEKELLTSQVSLAVDVHSGFGARDRFWFPYSHSRRPFPFLPESYAFKKLLDQTYPHHVYIVEPMSRQYTVHGDPWDHLFARHLDAHPERMFLPFCLEMGSWMWLRKNPLQAFSKHGVFNPMLPHRRSRILRRHLFLFDFLHRAVLSSDAWRRQSPEQREFNLQQAMELWYGE
jgi:hypothetical protein